MRAKPRSSPASPRTWNGPTVTRVGHGAAQRLCRSSLWPMRLSKPAIRLPRVLVGVVAGQGGFQIGHPESHQKLRQRDCVLDRRIGTLAAMRQHGVRQIPHHHRRPLMPALQRRHHEQAPARLERRCGDHLRDGRVPAGGGGDSLAGLGLDRPTIGARPMRRAFRDGEEVHVLPGAADTAAHHRNLHPRASFAGTVWRQAPRSTAAQLPNGIPSAR